MKDGSEIAKEWLKDLPATAEVPGFKPEDLVACEKCARKNPPTRANCVYCGTGLNISADKTAAIVPNLRPVEAWEKGFNLIILPKSVAGNVHNEESVRAVSKVLKFELPELNALLGKGIPLPVARVSTRAEAASLASQLTAFGFETTLGPDEDLNIAAAPVRLRGIEVDDETITFHHFNTGETRRCRWEEIALVVTGSIFEIKKESTERYTKKESEKKFTPVSEMSSDEPVVDIYCDSENTGWRILTRGFDFSFLGAQKSLLAVENIKHAVELLRQRATGARIDENYLRVRKDLNLAWPVEEKMESYKMQRDGVSKFNIDQVKSLSNSAQFLKFSRLQWRLLKEYK
jgi:hypothetical protein